MGGWISEAEVGTAAPANGRLERPQLWRSLQTHSQLDIELHFDRHMRISFLTFARA